MCMYYKNYIESNIDEKCINTIKQDTDLLINSSVCVCVCVQYVVMNINNYVWFITFHRRSLFRNWILLLKDTLI